MLADVGEVDAIFPSKIDTVVGMIGHALYGLVDSEKIHCTEPHAMAVCRAYVSK